MLGFSHRAYFAAVGLFAAWVGAWGYPDPTQIGRALPWTVPPLHARFIASMYLAGMLAMFLGLAARRAANVRIPLVLAACWTGLLFVVSLMELDAFDFGKPQVWFWMGAYLVYPLWGAWLAHIGPPGEQSERSDVALLAIAALCALLGLALLLAPSHMTPAWPWKVTPLLAHIYAGPFLAYAVCAWLLARERRAEARRIGLASMLAFVLLALLASWLHVGLFQAQRPASWAWFGGLAVSALLLAWRLAQAWRSPRETATAWT